MKRHGITGKIRPALDLPGWGSGFRRVFPFRRSWKAIIILAIFDVIFLIPAIVVFGQAAEGWAGFDDLHDLVFTVFSSAWLLGWSMVPLIMTLILLLLIFGREVVRVENGRFALFIGLPLLGLSARYEISAMRNLRFVPGDSVPKNKAWRGDHLAFDYGANDVEFGANATPGDVTEIQEQVTRLTGRTIRTGEATEEELAGQWDKSTLQSLSEPTEPSITPLATASPPKTTVWALVLANLVPVAGTLFFGWSLGDVMVLYWAESAVIGFFNLIKMAVIARWMAIFLGVFFIAHFGGFMAGHFLFIWGIFVQGFESSPVDELNEVVKHFIGLWPALAALFVSHAISFVTHFLGRKEYKDRTINDQMMEPYSRIVLMHITIIFGGGLAMIIGQTTPVLLLIIAGKIAVDVRAHLKEHRQSA